MRIADCALHSRCALVNAGCKRNSDLEHKELTRAKNAAYRFLAYRPRSRAEIEKKLCDKGFTPSLIETVKDHLLRLGYVNDQKFACQWVASRARVNGYGRRRIEQELRQKGVDRETIQEALAEALPLEDERETARKVVERKLRTMKSVEPEARRRRLAGFLERKGFPHEIIWDILRTV